MGSENISSKGQQDTTELAYDRIVTLIARRELQPGNLIEPREIAADLDISMSPVTRALQRLEHEGLVRILSRRGTFVENSNPQSLFDNLMMREAVECQAARLYCGKPITDNEPELLELARNVDEIPPDLNPEQGPDHWHSDIEFHRYLVSLTQSSDLIRAFKSTMQLGMLLSLSLFARSTEPPASHVALVESLATSDSDEAEHLIRRHLRTNKPSPLDFMDVLGHKSWTDI